VRQVLRSRLLRLSRRMERVREQQQSIGNLRIFGAEHAGLPAAIRLASDNDPLHTEIAKFLNCIAQAFTVPSGLCGTRWSVGARLAKGEIAAEHGHSRLPKNLCESHKQGRIAVSACTVG